jgi:hypothetical protein
MLFHVFQLGAIPEITERGGVGRQLIFFGWVVVFFELAFCLWLGFYNIVFHGWLVFFLT